MDQRLFAAASAAMERAYAPYSKFQVGAAILAGNGEIYSGCNVENAAYPVGTCAEAGAIAAMVAAGGTRIVAAVVVGESPAPSMPCVPCGGCRQKLREFASDDTPIVVADMQQVRARFMLGELLPHSFGPEHLK